MFAVLSFAPLAAPTWLYVLLAALAAAGALLQLAAPADGAPADGGTPADAGDPSDAPDSAAADAAAAGDDDDPDAVDEDDSDLPEHVRENPRFKATRTKLRREQRRWAKNRGVVERVAGLGGVEALEKLQQKARQAESFEAVLAANPKMRALLNGGAEPEDRPATPRTRHVDGLKNFDPEHPATPFMRQMAETLDRLEDENADLKQRFAGREHADTQEKGRAEAETWKAATDAAAATLDPTLREVFTDAVAGAFQHARRNNIAIKPQAVIDRYLKSIGASARAQGTASAAAAQRIASNNKQLPNRQPAGRPAPPVKARETVAQVTARLRKEGRFR